MNKLRLLTMLCMTVSSAVVHSATEVFHLAIGDPERRDTEVGIVLDGIVDTRAGQIITPEELARRLADTGILFIGEDHTNMDFHRVQYQIIRALYAAGRQVLIGLEMFPYTRQAELDRWSQGQYTDTEFLAAAKWYESWGYRWEYYRDIFRFARDYELRMFGINAPRKVIKMVRTEGFEKLDPDDAQHIPTDVNTDSEEHKRLFRAYFEEDDSVHMDLSEEQWAGIHRAQCTWDAVMGWNAMRALEQHGGPDAIIVVLIGAGHVTYGLGAERQIRPLFDGVIASLVPVPLRDGDGNPIELVQASYADFIWGLPPVADPLYPSLGVSLAGQLGKLPNKIIQVGEESVAADAGIAVGDVLVSVGEREIDSTATLRESLAAYEWGDSAEVTLRRGDEDIRLEVAFRRRVPEPEPS